MAHKRLLLLLAVSALLALQPAWRQEEGVEEPVAVEESDEYADSERALLIVQKAIKDELVVAGRNVTVTIDIYNAGSE